MNELTDYWNKRPCNVRHGTAPVGTPLWSEEVSIRKYTVEPHIIQFADFARWKDKRVLEIGCGIGTDTLQFLGAGAEVVAVDASVESLRLAAARASQIDAPVQFILADAEEFLPTSGPFDLIYSFGVLHHTPHPEKVLQRAHDALVDVGELRIMLYAKWSWKHLFTRQQPEAQAGCPYVKWYSKREARKLVEDCGFHVRSIEKTHIFPWRIKDYIEHRYKKAFPWNVMPKKLFDWLETILGHHLLIQAVKQ
jgi:SAM-dependent methyltransferase